MLASRCYAFQVTQERSDKLQLSIELTKVFYHHFPDSRHPQCHVGLPESRRDTCDILPIVSSKVVSTSGVQGLEEGLKMPQNTLCDQKA